MKPEILLGPSNGHLASRMLCTELMNKLKPNDQISRRELGALVNLDLSSGVGAVRLRKAIEWCVSMYKTNIKLLFGQGIVKHLQPGEGVIEVESGLQGVHRKVRRVRHRAKAVDVNNLDEAETRKLFADLAAIGAVEIFSGEKQRKLMEDKGVKPHVSWEKTLMLFNGNTT